MSSYTFIVLLAILAISTIIAALIIVLSRNDPLKIFLPLSSIVAGIAPYVVIISIQCNIYSYFSLFLGYLLFPGVWISSIALSFSSITLNIISRNYFLKIMHHYNIFYSIILVVALYYIIIILHVIIYFTWAFFFIE